MNDLLKRSLVFAFGGLAVLCTGGLTEAQLQRLPPPGGYPSSGLRSPGYPPAGLRVAQHQQPAQSMLLNDQVYAGDKMTYSDEGYYESKPARNWSVFGSMDYLYVRPHFSQAIAFARGTQNPPTFNTQSFTSEGLDFDYDSSFRASVGARWDCGNELRFSYWNLQGEVQVDGAPGGPGEFIVDPFGGVVGANVAVLNPNDARFGTVINGGANISTVATVDLSIYDIDYVFASWSQPNWRVACNAGVRIADVEQYYQSTIRALGFVATQGEFTAEFLGAGPKVGVLMERCFGHRSQFTVFADTQGSLLLGDYHVASEFNAFLPTFGSAAQDETMTRIIPVVETELGVGWQPTDYLQLRMSWMFQAWFDMGTSGGTFGGFYAGADDANTMSFDGLTARVELRY